MDGMSNFFSGITQSLTLKDFMKDIAFGIDGAEDDSDPAEGTVIVYWKQFMAGWRCDNDAIPLGISHSRS
jgi:hypothetical protein